MNTYQEETSVSDSDLREARFDKDLGILYSGQFSLTKIIKISENIKELEIPSSVRIICNYAFKCSNISNVIFPESIKCIGHHAFHFSLVEHITLNEGLKFIGADAFKECRSLKELNLPTTVEEIGERAFRKCLKIKCFVIPKNVKVIGGGVFAGCKYAQIKSLSEDFKIYNKCLFQVSTRKLLSCWATEESIKVLNGTFVIAKYAFDGMWFLKEVFLPKSVEEIEEFAFEKGVKIIWVPQGEIERFSLMANGRYARYMMEY